MAVVVDGVGRDPFKSRSIVLILSFVGHDRKATSLMTQML
jgi:hypothetical protein